MLSEINWFMSRITIFPWLITQPSLTRLSYVTVRFFLLISWEIPVLLHLNHISRSINQHLSNHPQLFIIYGTKCFSYLIYTIQNGLSLLITACILYHFLLFKLRLILFIICNIEISAFLVRSNCGILKFKCTIFQILKCPVVSDIVLHYLNI